MAGQGLLFAGQEPFGAAKINPFCRDPLRE
jgi:hypothetical protein